jgi:hypothetical protein
LREEPGEPGFGATAVTVGVDVRRQRDATAGDEMGGEPIDRGASLGRNGEQVGGAQTVAPERVPAK